MLEKVIRDLKKDVNYTDIFKFIDPYGNDSFSEMSGLDLQELLLLIDGYYLEYRSLLGFDQSVTFGTEIEFEFANKEKIKEVLVKMFPNGLWFMKNDGSVVKGAEISSPILKDNTLAWKELKDVCNVVEQFASVGLTTGGHVHIGAQVIGDNPKSWLDFIKMWAIYENIIYRFSYGEFLNGRPCMKKYALPMSEMLIENYEKLSASENLTMELIMTILHRYHKTCAINFSYVDFPGRFKERNTIEFRCPNGSLEPTVWQNNINLFVNLLECARSGRFNDDIAQKRYERNKDYYDSFDFYNQIYLQQSLELCDMVFTNNFDKVYFLRQYFKSFEIRDDQVGIFNNLGKSKQFILK